jgi:UDP-2,3-diacylglucosamine pyrophosphatase LpxH
MQRVCFVSDLHLFSHHSEAARYDAAIHRAAGRASVFVLGGDIFDFRWSTLGSVRATIDAADRWLADLAGRHPHCHFHYLLGNHDYHRGWIQRLTERQRHGENFTWHRFYLRLNDTVFLHGDVADRWMTAAMLVAARARWLQPRQPGRVRRGAYNLVCHVGLHTPLPYLVHRKRRVARRILAYLEDIGEGPRQGVRHVYFGHIHRRLSGYRYGGLSFHNGGASIRRQRLHVLEALI